MKPTFVRIGDRYIPIDRVYLVRDRPDGTRVWIDAGPRSTEWVEVFTGDEQRQARAIFDSLALVEPAPTPLKFPEEEAP